VDIRRRRSTNGGASGFWEHSTQSATWCGNGTVTKTYDALNRISSQVIANTGLHYNGCGPVTYPSSYEVLYDWGPNGHPIRIGSPPVLDYINGIAPSPPPSFGTVAYDTIHWDGDAPLFSTNSTGQLDNIKVGTLGDVTPTDIQFTGLTIWDRDSSGSVISDHNSSGNDSLTQPDPFHTNYCNGQFNGSNGFHGETTTAGLPGKFVGQGTALAEPGADGIYDGANTIQGVRTYDSTAGSWTTPDAYVGDVHDPMSQRSYMWNRNNPLSYIDPTGYVWESVDPIFSAVLSRLNLSAQFSAEWKAIGDSPRRFRLINADLSHAGPGGTPEAGYFDSKTGTVAVDWSLAAKFASYMEKAVAHEVSHGYDFAHDAATFFADEANNSYCNGAKGCSNEELKADSEATTIIQQELEMQVLGRSSDHPADSTSAAETAAENGDLNSLTDWIGRL
jgi:hypothetical protein